jgi:hypothetical protein
MVPAQDSNTSHSLSFAKMEVTAGSRKEHAAVDADGR